MGAELTLTKLNLRSNKSAIDNLANFS